MRTQVATAADSLPAIVAALRPLQDRVLMRVIEEEVPLDRVLVIKDNPHCVNAENTVFDEKGENNDYRRRGILGEIISVGPGKWVKPEHGKEFFRATTVQPGERVIFTNWNDWEGAPAGFAMVTEGDIWGYPVENRLLPAPAGSNPFACRKKRKSR